MQVVLGVVGRFRDRTDGLADLQAEIPKRIKDGFDERLRGGGVARYEHQEVNIAERAKLGAPVAACGDKADRGGGGPSLQEKSVEQDVDRVGAEFCDFAAENTRTMGRQLDFPSLSQEHPGPRHELAL